MAKSKKPVLQFVYPEYISDNFYSNRKITITVKTQPEESKAADAVAFAKDGVEKMVNFAKGISESVEDTRLALESNAKGKNDVIVANLVLPLPNSFTDQQQHQWSQETGFVGTLGNNFANATASDFLPTKYKGVADKLTGGVSLDKSLAELTKSAGVRKPLFDPGFFQNYSGSAPRQFSMGWDFIPNSAKEAVAAMTIIMKLKEYAAPTRQLDGVSLLAPHYLSITMNNPWVSAMINLDRVVISSISVEYGADGGMQQTSDGHPKHISLSLQLQEVDMTVSQDFSSTPK